MSQKMSDSAETLAWKTRSSEGSLATADGNELPTISDLLWEVIRLGKEVMTLKTATSEQGDDSAAISAL